MLLLPAIDIRDGRAVRLVQGDYARETTFDADPLEAARRWAGQGARALHIVDLDGARGGEPENLEHLRRIRAEIDLPIQFGGGLRSAESVETALAAGAERVVLGTAALSDPMLVESLAADHGPRIVVGADARAGRIAVEGWKRDSAMTPDELVATLGERGVTRFVYTPVEVDGTLQGPGTEGLASVAEAAARTGAEVVYSGGIGELSHLSELARLAPPALTGVIVGRALYEGRFDVAQARAALERPDA
ncbi:1-(5-phosphoribosyl)-5-[(5-phosphoribosylamino)methylideneamino]imidazole-4-carboxamide isomerase [Thermoleophilia bacterium SCSIO 60948]|nr:1-(5-phosphoribosyl)-5-[(5-phosphoribosylamino)methylideneamino]imidazole-4-carboxamide isomerase [Thermoleophilia bacterium SCSIO 60948]